MDGELGEADSDGEGGVGEATQWSIGGRERLYRWGGSSQNYFYSTNYMIMIILWYGWENHLHRDFVWLSTPDY